MLSTKTKITFKERDLEAMVTIQDSSAPEGKLGDREKMPFLTSPGAE